jgi:hypothetical protein
MLGCRALYGTVASVTADIDKVLNAVHTAAWSSAAEAETAAVRELDAAIYAAYHSTQWATSVGVLSPRFVPLLHKMLSARGRGRADVAASSALIKCFPFRWDTYQIQVQRRIAAVRSAAHAALLKMPELRCESLLAPAVLHAVEAELQTAASAVQPRDIAEIRDVLLGTQAWLWPVLISAVRDTEHEILDCAVELCARDICRNPSGAFTKACQLTAAARIQDLHRAMLADGWPAEHQCTAAVLTAVIHRNAQSIRDRLRILRAPAEQVRNWYKQAVERHADLVGLALGHPLIYDAVARAAVSNGQRPPAAVVVHRVLQFCRDEIHREMAHATARCALTTAEIVQRVEHFVGLNLEAEIPPTPSMEDTVRVATAIRQCMTAQVPSGLCAVCSCACPGATITKLPYTAVPHLELLRTDGPKTPKCPRDAVTVCRLPDNQQYCLQPAAVEGENVAACSDCLAALHKAAVPQHALVRVDTGAKPDKPHLEWPTYLEQLCIGLLRPHKATVVCRPDVPPDQAWRDWPNHRGQRFLGHISLLGHVTAHPNPTPQEMSEILPLPLEHLPEVIHVVLLTAASDLQEAKAHAARCRALRVRGRVVAAWARHLSNIYQLPVNDALLSVYESIDGIPDGLLTAQNTVYAQTAEEVNILQRAYTEKREGYADSL